MLFMSQNATLEVFLPLGISHFRDNFIHLCSKMTHIFTFKFLFCFNFTIKNDAK